MTEDNSPWKVAGVSIGRGNGSRPARECEAACGWFVAGDSVGIAVADGAGSASRSATGSAVAVRAALSAIAHKHLTIGPSTARTGRSVLTAAFEAAAQTIHDEAQSLGLEPGDLAS